MAVWLPDSTASLPVKGGKAGQVMRGLSVAAFASLRSEGERLIVWSPLLMVMGIWTYFALRSEPSAMLAAVLALASISVFIFGRANKASLALGIVITGFCLAVIRTQLVATPVLRAYAPDISIEGIVTDVDRRSAKRLVVIVELLRADGLPATEIPRSARLQLTGQKLAPQIGDRILGKATLQPLPLPVSPGAFDYGRSLYFQSIGATGRFTGPVVIDSSVVAGRHLLKRSFHGLRRSIGERIRAVIPGSLGSFADALITGERAAIPRAMNQSLQTSGLFHILSISGLHMSLVVGSSFWIVRAILALFGSLALVYPIKKWAAAAAFVVALFYMLLADSGAATERSFIMIAVMLFAVMVDRPAISLHNLALAAIAILVLEPEQAVAASFQMSFLAVMGLAAFFEWWSARLTPDGIANHSLAARWSRKAVIIVAAAVLTSVIAGGLSSIAAVHHFGRMAPYGVVANALALPVVSIVVMPMALLATILMPLGLERPALIVMEQGLFVVVAISDWVAGWPGANFILPKLGATPATLAAIAAAFLCIPVSRLRLACIPLLFLAIAAALGQSRPDVVIEERARTVAVRDGSGMLVPLDAKKSSFAITKWLQDDGDTSSTAVASKRPLWTCDAAVCQARRNGISIAYLRETAAVIKPCPKVDVIVAQYPLRRNCKGARLTIDRFDVWRNGAYALDITADGIGVTTVRGLQGSRPWTYEPRARSKN